MPQLGEFIDRMPSHELRETTGHAMVGRTFGVAVRLRDDVFHPSPFMRVGRPALPHGPQLPQPHQLAPLADALMGDERRPAGQDRNRHRRDSDQRTGRDQKQCAGGALHRIPEVRATRLGDRSLNDFRRQKSSLCVEYKEQIAIAEETYDIFAAFLHFACAGAPLRRSGRPRRPACQGITNAIDVVLLAMCLVTVSKISTSNGRSRWLPEISSRVLSAVTR